jgi:RNA polymerase sigma factor (TIGR02999 family)
MESDEKIGEVTAILREWRSGDVEAVDKLMPIVIEKLRSLARQNLRKYSNSSVGREVQPTEIVNDAYLKLKGASLDSAKMPERSEHFYALCAKTIKDILVDYSRRKTAGKRGGRVKDISLEDTIDLSWLKDNKNPSAEDVVTFQEVLDRLVEKYKREGNVLHLKYYVEMTDEEIAESLNISVPTVRRDLIFARAWVRREIDRMTSDIVDQASRIGDPDARQEFLLKACAGNDSLLRDVQLLIKKQGRG